MREIPTSEPLSRERRDALKVSTPSGFATAIMYLNDTGPGGGGETVFPVDDAVAASDENCYEATLFGERPASAIRTSERIPRPVRVSRPRLVRRSSGKEDSRNSQARA